MATPATVSASLRAQRQVHRRPPQHDLGDAFPKLAAADSGRAEQRRLHIIFANAQYPRGINSRLRASRQHVFIARTLALLHQLRSDPPHQRVKPENGLYHKRHPKLPTHSTRTGGPYNEMLPQIKYTNINGLLPSYGDI
jgi:hypothetical protein